MAVSPVQCRVNPLPTTVFSISFTSQKILVAMPVAKPALYRHSCHHPAIPPAAARGSILMKVNVSVEATAQEMREFLGLPNVQPLHDDILQTCPRQYAARRDQLRRPRFDQTAATHPVPLDGNGAKILGSGRQGQRRQFGRTKEANDRKAESPPESRESGTARNDDEKSA
jgi:hypothetical protein